MLIQRYLAREMLRPMIGIFLFLLVIVLVFYASQLLARAALEGLPMDIVTRMAALRLGLFLDVLIPIALLLGIVIGLGRMQSSHEITALASVGAGRRRIVLALLVWLLGLVLLVAALSMLFRPWAYTTLYALERQLAAQLDLDRVEPGRFQVGSDQWLVYAEGRSDGGLDRVMVRQLAEDFSGLLRAQRLTQETVEEGVLRLIFEGNVRSYTMTDGEEADIVALFDRFDVLLEVSPPPPREQLRRAMSMASLKASGAPIEMAELQWRLVSPASVIVLALAGIALSRINPRLGQSARVLSATLMATIYFSALGVLINWVEQGDLPFWPGAFIAPLLVLMALTVRYWLVQRGPGPPL
ncbi:MAG: LPS export ABC transporter permease LptF [Wenzhouxiangella sp.]